MKQFLALLAIVVILGSPTLAEAQVVNHKAIPGVKVAVLCSATPADAKLDVYPLASGPLTTEQGAGLGLTATFLHYPLQAFNHHREVNPRCGGSWIPEIIPAGTLVWVNAQGYVAYKASCGNRLAYNGPATAAPKVTPAPKPRVRGRAFWRWLGDLFMYGPFYTIE